MYRKYMVYVDDGIAVYKIAVPAENEQGARDFVSGNGEVIAVKDVTEEMYINADKVLNALSEVFNGYEVDLMVRALRDIGIID